tara:strand:- start:10489 stop:10635 length:147 start_codon:yes stop_codon:yes gene_type:complete
LKIFKKISQEKKVALPPWAFVLSNSHSEHGFVLKMLSRAFVAWRGETI